MVGVPFYEETLTIPVGFKKGDETEYTIELAENNFSNDIGIVLEDTETGQFIDLKNQLHWLVIPEKAMLLNSKLGQRLLDHCKSPAHSNLVSTSPQ